jgi:putative transposase
MPDYRRHKVFGGCYFFTVNLLERHGNRLLTQEIELLRQAVRRVRKARPFTIDAWVVLPDHLHAVWTLPVGDDDFSTRWRLIKTFFAQGLPPIERPSRVRREAGERGISSRRGPLRFIRRNMPSATPPHAGYAFGYPTDADYSAVRGDAMFGTDQS